jgi:hypothetical protein
VVEFFPTWTPPMQWMSERLDRLNLSFRFA